MAGIYIHIPFCKQRCHYCDFYSTTQLKFLPGLVEAIVNELQLRKDWLLNEPIETIYFGGGTPSVLRFDNLMKIFDHIHKAYPVTDKAEITLEANPDDLSATYLKDLSKTPINRLSVGIQSFNNDILKLMNRRHSAQQAQQVVKQSQDAGITNISVDLIYGVPGQEMELWNENLEQVNLLDVPHLSAYHLTIEPNTVFYKKQQQNQLLPINEEDSLLQFKTLINWSEKNGFEQYEISNFARNGLYSQHNANYWKQVKYLGVGPSAHSYNFSERAWNINHLQNYIQMINKGEQAFEIEHLSPSDQHNDYLITRLRTKWGVSLDEFEALFGRNRKEDLLIQAMPYIKKGDLISNQSVLKLSKEGIFISDAILTDLIWLPDNNI